MSELAEVDEFATCLRILKERSGRSFEALGRRLAVSGSTLHRYCSGTGVPPEYSIIERFAKECGATPPELLELHRKWLRADAARRRAESGGSGGSGEGPGALDSIGYPVGPPVAHPRRSTGWVVGAVAAVVAILVASWLVFRTGDRPGTSASGDDGRLLFSSACPDTVSMGEHDECVREVQTLLRGAGATIAVDGEFGPETLRRLTAFQVFAGITAIGVADEHTKSALYDGKTHLSTWTPAQVERRIRQVFVEEPDRAVVVAKCQSRLDPLWVLPNTNGTRNWGVFQISDTTLAKLGGTPRKAFDPAWNIEAAHRLWLAHRDFRDWPYCAQVFLSPSPAPTVTSRPARP